MVVASGSNLQPQNDTIQNNARFGIWVLKGAVLRAFDLTIAGNNSAGVSLSQASSAAIEQDVTGNVITGNGGNGVSIGDLSFVEFDGTNNVSGNLTQHYVTAAYLFVDMQKRTLTYAGAGHPPLLLWGGSSDGVRAVEENGLFLGAFEFATYSSVELPLQPGHWGLLYYRWDLGNNEPIGNRVWHRPLQGGQHVRIAAHFLDRLLPVGLEDSHRPARAHTMAVQEQHDLSYLFRILPCLLDSLPAFRPDPIDGLQFRDPVFDHAQDFGSEPPDQLLGQNRPDAFDQAAAEVPLNAFNRRGRHGFHELGLELEPVLFVSNPPALGLKPLPGSYGRQRSKDCYLVPVPSDF
jgi:hypothetical protein